MGTSEIAGGAPQRRSGMTVALFAIKVAASVGLLWLATRGIDFGAAFASVDSVDPLRLLLAPATMMAATTVNAFRWRRLMVAHVAPLSLRQATALLFVTQFFNSGLPSTLGGDAARIVYAVRQGAPAPNVLTATVLDRFAGYSSVILYAAAVVLFQPFGLIFPAVWSAVLLLLALAVPGGLLVLYLVNLIPRPDAWIDPSSRGLRSRASRLLAPLLGVRIKLRAVLFAIVASVPIVVLVGITLFLLNAATCGCDDLDLSRAIAIAGPLVLAVSIPISMAGWGVREVVMIGLYGLMGLPPEQALVTSVLFGVVVFVAGLPGLIIWLGLRVPQSPR